MRATQLAQCLTERLVDRPGNPDAQPSAQHPPKRGDRIAPALGGGQRRAGVGEERLARFRQPDRAWVAVKQGLAELAFEATDLGADGGLSHQQAAGGTGELPLVRHRGEVRELSQFHNDPLLKP